MFRTLSYKETKDFENWRRNHNCISNVEFLIIPDVVDQSTRVRCLTCKEEVNITDWECA